MSVKDILTMDGASSVNAITAQFKPKRIDILKDENIVFDDDRDHGFFNRGEQDQSDNDEEKRMKAEQYRKRFEEALIRIEDQEDVDAMQHANREMHDNDDQDQHEFDDNPVEGMSEEQLALYKKAKEEQMEQAKMKEAMAKQNINDGIRLKQGEIKKHEEIIWSENANLNQVTK